MFIKNKKIENEILNDEIKELNDEIKELKKKLKKYEEDRDNTLSGLLKDFDYAIIVDKCNSRLFNAGRWEEGVRHINFEYESCTLVPTLTIEK